MMNLVSVTQTFQQQEIYHSSAEILGFPSVIAYEKKFKWLWFATQLNTFIVVSDYKDTRITPELLGQHLAESFSFSRKNHTGFPRGFQSGLAVISVLVSSQISDEAKTYCEQLKSGKKWAGFAIPVVFDSVAGKTYAFQKNPMWGRIYFPHIKKHIENLTY